MMANLFDRKATKFAGTAPRDQRRQRSAAGVESWNKTMASLAGNTEDRSGPRNSIIGFGGASNLPELTEAAQKNEPFDKLHPAVAPHARKLSAESAKLLSKIVERHEATKEPINVTVSDVQQLTGANVDLSGRILDTLITNGYLKATWSKLGFKSGYLPVL